MICHNQLNIIMSLKRQRTSSISSVATMPGYGYRSYSTRSAPSSRGRFTKGSYLAAKGTTKKASVRASPALRAAVKKIIQNQKEQKLSVRELNSGNILTLITTEPTGPTGPDMFSLAPVMTQGAGANDRIGNDIRLVKSVLKFNVWLTGESSSGAGPFFLTVWLGRIRGLGAASPSDADYARLLIASGATFTGPTTNSPITSILPVNEDLWDIKLRKQYKLGKENINNKNNNDFNYAYQEEIDITKMLPSVNSYDETSSTVETNNLFLFFTYTTVDGSTPALGLPQAVASVSHRYTDA